MSPHRKYTVFFSYASPDTDLVKALHELFEHLGERTYYAPKELAQSGSAPWRQHIIEGIRASHAIVPVYTRHSIHRPWVLYECGAGDELALPRFPVKVAGVKIEDIQFLPSPNVQIHDLSTADGLFDFTVAVLHSRHPRESNSRRRQRVRSALKHGRGDRIRALARERRVFIAGNVPQGKFRQESVVRRYGTDAQFQERLAAFTRLLTHQLLERGLCISSCPQVESVGRVAAVLATRWQAELQRKGELAEGERRFAIGGIYPIDHHARERKTFKFVDRQWQELLKDFRKTYLRNVEWLVLIGGSEGTMEEYEAGREIEGLKVLSIPCFGGAAGRIWRSHPDVRHPTCDACKQRYRACETDALKGIAEHICKTYANPKP